MGFECGGERSGGAVEVYGGFGGCGKWVVERKHSCSVCIEKERDFYLWEEEENHFCVSEAMS